MFVVDNHQFHFQQQQQQNRNISNNNPIVQFKSTNRDDDNLKLNNNNNNYVPHKNSINDHLANTCQNINNNNNSSYWDSTYQANLSRNNSQENQLMAQNISSSDLNLGNG